MYTWKSRASENCSDISDLLRNVREIFTLIREERSADSHDLARSTGVRRPPIRGCSNSYEGDKHFGPGLREAHDGLLLSGGIPESLSVSLWLLASSALLRMPRVALAVLWSLRVCVAVANFTHKFETWPQSFINAYPRLIEAI
jgi:hypothetical protein